MIWTSTRFQAARLRRLTFAGVVGSIVALALPTSAWPDRPTDNVVVVNPPNQPVPTVGVNTPDSQPFSQRLDITLNGNEGSGSFVVPAGKTLVIDYISSDAAINGTAILFDVATFLHGNEVEAHLPMVFIGTLLNRNTYAMSAPVKIYADGNSTVTIAIVTAGTGGGGLIVGIYGHLV